MKYRLTEETIEVNGHILHRIECIESFGVVKVGDKGGWIEKEENLSQYGNAWVDDNAKAYGNAKVYGNARVYHHAKVYDYAKVYGNAKVYDYAKVCDYARVFGNAIVYGNAEIYGNAEVNDIQDYMVFKNWWSSGRYFTWIRSNNMWRVGCFYGAGEQLIAKAYNDSEISGREYERVVNYVESILEDNFKEG